MEQIRYRAMMGEYLLYYCEKIIGYLCDDCFLVKPVPAAKRLLPQAPLVSPYPGAKELLLVEDVEDETSLQTLLENMYPQLPIPKNKQTSKGN